MSSDAVTIPNAPNTISGLMLKVVQSLFSVLLGRGAIEDEQLSATELVERYRERPNSLHAPQRLAASYLSASTEHPDQVNVQAALMEFRVGESHSGDADLDSIRADAHSYLKALAGF